MAWTPASPSMTSSMPREELPALRLGGIAAAATAGLTAVAFGTAVLAVPSAGAFCPADCLSYPYSEAVDFKSIDFVWLYPATVLMPVLVVLLAALETVAPIGRRVYGRVAFALGTAGAAILAVNYAVQLLVVQPALVRQELAGITPWLQYNPYGAFIVLEDLGYLLVALAFGFLATLFPGPGIERAVRWTFSVASGAAVVATLILGVVYRLEIQDRLEVALILIDWTALIVVGPLLAVLFRRRMRALGTYGPTGT